MKRIKYWLPVVMWMAVLFPLWNQFLSGPVIYRLHHWIWRWLVPDASMETMGLSYVYLRKLLHVGAYAILAFLLYRFFRADNPNRWRWGWAAYAAVITVGYGAMDELLQTLVVSRDASFSDLAMDAVGTSLILGIIFLKHKNSKQ